MLAALSLPELAILVGSTAGVAVLHTLAGPDHYLPFIVFRGARGWTSARTTAWTVACGLGHVGSSVALALAATALGAGLERVELIEEWRGSFAAWAMIAFGAVYLAWGIKRGLRAHHAQGHAQDHEPAVVKTTPWVLFTIFVFGPCEPMIPLVMYPAAKGAWLDVSAVVLVFGVLTVGAMLIAVHGAGCLMRGLPLEKIGRANHAIAGATVLAAGCAIQFLGW